MENERSSGKLLGIGFTRAVTSSSNPCWRIPSAWNAQQCLQEFDWDNAEREFQERVQQKGKGDACGPVMFFETEADDDRGLQVCLEEAGVFNVNLDVNVPGKFLWFNVSRHKSYWKGELPLSTVKTMLELYVRDDISGLIEALQ